MTEDLAVGGNIVTGWADTRFRTSVGGKGFKRKSIKRKKEKRIRKEIKKGKTKKNTIPAAKTPRIEAR